MKPSRVAVTSGGSLITALLSFLPLSCCVFPVAFSFLGAGGLAFAMSLMPYRFYFVALTLLFLGIGFYFAYRPEKVDCVPGAACGSPRNRKVQRASLWVVTVLTLILLAFPYVIPYLPVEWMGELNIRGTSMTIKIASVFFALFLLTGVAFSQVTNKQERTKTISVHIDGFMKSKSGSV